MTLPTPCPSECALNDPCDPNFAVEGAYMEGKKVYQFYNATDNIRIVWRDGQHHGFEDIQSYFDWFDAAFARTAAISIAANFPEVAPQICSFPPPPGTVCWGYT